MNNLAAQSDLHGTLMMEMDAKLTRLIQQEAGKDDLSSLPFVNSKLQFHLKAHA